MQSGLAFSFARTDSNCTEPEDLARSRSQRGAVARSRTSPRQERWGAMELHKPGAPLGAGGNELEADSEHFRS